MRTPTILKQRDLVANYQLHFHWILIFIQSFATSDVHSLFIFPLPQLFFHR